MQPSTLFQEKATSARKALHIVTTSFLEGNEVLVGYSDGSSAIFEAEELEKLRPVPKQVLPAAQSQTEQPRLATAS